MSERVCVTFSIPAKAEKLPAVDKMLDDLQSYELENVSDFYQEKGNITTYQFFDSSTHMSGWETALHELVDKKVPFDMMTESYSDVPETHYAFREGMKEPFEFTGEEPSVPVSVLRDIIKNDPDYTREHLIEYLDSQFPEFSPLKDVVKAWEKKAFAVAR